MKKNKKIIYIEEYKCKFIVINNNECGNINRNSYSFGIEYTIFENIILKDFNDLEKLFSTIVLKLKKPIRFNHKDYYTENNIKFTVDYSSIKYNILFNLVAEIKISDLNE